MMYISELPTEIVERVLLYLASSCATLAACRLVCRAWHHASTSLLCRRITLAKRSGNIRSLHCIMNSPNLRCHVQELLYDASSYVREHAHDVRSFSTAVHHWRSESCQPYFRQLSVRESRNGPMILRHYNVYCVSLISL